MEITLRLEQINDYKTVETLTREAFWNVHVPGCDEHLLLHHLRGAKAFVKELDFVAVYNHKIAGNIVYAESNIIDSDREYTMLTFGPVSVLPEYQNRGIGGKLITHTVKKAAAMGYRAIIIYGDIEYYKRFGFVESKKYNITNKEHQFPAALLALELYPNALTGIQGVFDEGSAYAINGDELEEFEKGFVTKEKGFARSQERFNELSKKYL